MLTHVIGVARSRMRFIFIRFPFYEVKENCVSRYPRNSLDQLFLNGFWHSVGRELKEAEPSLGNDKDVGIQQLRRYEGRCVVGSEK